MDKKAKIASISALVLAMLVLAMAVLAAPKQCRDGIDNDGDGAVDYPADFSCSSAQDNDETNPKAQCQDGIDNDGDGHTDYLGDSKCVNRQDNNESPKDSCADTDGGIVLGTVGTVSGDDEGFSYSYTDVCLDATTLLERYCGTLAQDYSPLNSTQNCSTGNGTNGTCSAGRCI